MKKKIILFLAVQSLITATAWAQPDPKTTTDKFASLLNYIEYMYVDSVNSKELTEKAIISLLEELDPHSTYISAEEVQEANEPLEGSFDGIGVQFNILHDTIMVVEPIQGGPSEKLGIRGGDKIVTVDGVNVAGVGMKNTDVFKKLRGPRGTKVKVGILRKGVPGVATYEIIRDKIPIYSIDAAYIAAEGLGDIKVSRFAKTTTEELHKALDDLKKKGMRDLVLDLQDNGGGMLSAAIDMCDEFLDKDKLIVFTKGRTFPEEKTNAKPRVKGRFEEGRLVVLIDESSASASEIVSGAIQDWDRGVIVGRRSFGKGLVQRPIPLPDGSMVRLTVQKYYTPAGRCIQKPYEKGLEDYEMDYLKRLKNGEFFHADSIKFSEKDKYETRLTHRTVYGGGGIMPDVFVPLDTSENSKYFSNLLRVGITNDWTMEYVDAHRDELKKKYPTSKEFISQFMFSEAEVQAFIQEAEKKEVKFNEVEFARSKQVILIRMKALVGRGIYENESFYEIINELNPAFKRGMEILVNGEFEKMPLGFDEYKMGKSKSKK